MSRFKVELDAYVIPDDHTVWKVSPGKTYRFYRAVRESNFIFPDIRGLDDINKPFANWNDKEVLKQITADRHSRELASAARGAKGEVRSHTVKSDRETLTFANRLWNEAKRGDLVIVPADGYDKDVLIGIIESDSGAVSSTKAKDGEHEGIYFGRRVRWLHAIPKFELEGDLIKALHARSAVYAIAENLKEYVYRLAFGNFTYKGNYVAEFKTGKQKFTAEDAAVVSAWLNGFQVLHHRLENGRGLADGTSFESLGLAELPAAAAGDLKININSPGEIFLKTKTPLALSLMALFTLAACDSKEVVREGVTIKLQSVAGAARSKEKEVAADVDNLTNALGEVRLQTSNKYAVRAEKKAKISTAARLK